MSEKWFNDDDDDDGEEVKLLGSTFYTHFTHTQVEINKNATDTTLEDSATGRDSIKVTLKPLE